MSWFKRMLGWPGQDATPAPSEAQARAENSHGASTSSHAPKRTSGDHGQGRKAHRSTAGAAAAAAAAARAAKAAGVRDGPVLEELDDGVDGGIQGLTWYGKSMMQDAEGDVAGAFVAEEQVAQPGTTSKSKKVRPAKPPVKVHSVERGNVVLV